VGQMASDYNTLQEADEETRTTMFKKIEADLQESLSVNDSHLPIATRMRQASEQLTNLVRTILFFNSLPNICLLVDSLFEV